MCKREACHPWVLLPPAGLSDAPGQKRWRLGDVPVMRRVIQVIAMKLRLRSQIDLLHKQTRVTDVFIKRVRACDVLPWSLWCTWRRSWWRTEPETIQRWCWWCEACNPVKYTHTYVITHLKHTHTHTGDASLTGSPGVQCNFLLTSTPGNVLYMMTDDTNTNRVKEKT